MLQLESGIVLPTAEYTIICKEDGLDELHFTLPAASPIWAGLYNDLRILEVTEQQFYVVQRGDVTKSTAKIAAQLDLRDWRKKCIIDFDNNNQTLLTTLRSICPTGWTVVEHDPKVQTQTLRRSQATALQIALQAANVFSAALRFDTKKKQVQIVWRDSIAASIQLPAGSAAVLHRNGDTLEWNVSADALPMFTVVKLCDRFGNIQPVQVVEVETSPHREGKSKLTLRRVSEE